jgi:cystathionine beta-lyase family protein involved in aluminum resistance
LFKQNTEYEIQNTQNLYSEKDKKVTMKTYPLKSITLDQAEEKQFRLVDEIAHVFSGKEFLDTGDLGVVVGLNKPVYAGKVEEVLAHYFHTEKALLVTGSGTGALRWGLTSMLKPGDTLLIHTAPIYPTTKVTLDAMGVKTVAADYNQLAEIKRTMKEHPEIKGALVQYTRQLPSDSYDMSSVITAIKECSDIPIITDDNYAVMKVEKIGVELGADLCGFSCFKLLGPEGVGVILGRKKYIDAIETMNYSGGSKVQGWQAMEVLRGLVYAPVALAIQATVNEQLVERLSHGEIPEVKDAFIANSQSKVLLVEFKEDIAEQVLAETQKLGGLPNPVGAESKYEILPMFYRVSGTFRKADPTLEKRMIRINPNRSGTETIMRILKEGIRRAVNNVSK